MVYLERGRLLVPPYLSQLGCRACAHRHTRNTLRSMNSYRALINQECRPRCHASLLRATHTNPKTIIKIDI